MRSILLLAIFSLGTLQIQAQQATRGNQDQELFRTIQSLDAQLFDAYNKCDLDKFASFLPEQLEFYHDNGGLTDTSRTSLVASVKENICGKVERQLIPESLQVYPMHGYGALEIGRHRFLHPGREKTEPVGEGQFIHLWQNQNGAWKLTRIISYDHHAAGK